MVSIEQVKSYLYQVKNFNKMIDYKMERLKELNEESTSIHCPNYSGDRVQTSPTGDAIPRMIAKIIDMQEEINNDIDYFIDLKAQIRHTIERLNNADAIVILYSKYFEYKTIQQIADDTGHCRRTVQRMHRKALKEMAEFDVIENYANSKAV